MPYVPLKNSFFAIPSATLATPATVHNQNSQSVATVATVAREVAKNENVSAISIASCEADDCAPETDPVFWQGVADERNAAAAARGGDDRRGAQLGLGSRRARRSRSPHRDGRLRPADCVRRPGW